MVQGWKFGSNEIVCVCMCVCVYVCVCGVCVCECVCVCVGVGVCVGGWVGGCWCVEWVYSLVCVLVPICISAFGLHCIVESLIIF